MARMVATYTGSVGENGMFQVEPSVVGFDGIDITEIRFHWFATSYVAGSNPVLSLAISPNDQIGTFISASESKSVIAWINVDESGRAGYSASIAPLDRTVLDVNSIWCGFVSRSTSGTTSITVELFGNFLNLSLEEKTKLAFAASVH